MKNWETVTADEDRIMNKHYTPGRGGKRIKYIVRHHNAGVRLSTADCWNLWQTREASAHYQVEDDGRIGQLVWDRDTAWHAANLTRNQESIGIEHANTAGPQQDWPISDATIDAGAHLAAALCKVHGLGRPAFGVNIRDHKETGQTGCPWHLSGPAGKYHKAWMDAAQAHYDRMTGGTSSPAQNKEDDMTPAQEKKIDQLIALVQDVRLQQGAGDNYSGFPQGGRRSLYDLMAAVAAKVGVPATKDTKA